MCCGKKGWSHQDGFCQGLHTPLFLFSAGLAQDSLKRVWFGSVVHLHGYMKGKFSEKSGLKRGVVALQDGFPPGAPLCSVPLPHQDWPKTILREGGLGQWFIDVAI